MNRLILLKNIKKEISDIAPEAKVILYGSQSREDAGPESDWDFLVLVDGPVDDNLTDTIRHRLYEIEWDTGEVISCIVRNRKKWHQRPYNETPFYQTVSQEGIPL
jgi:predicted nucleotidyltransferase